MNVLYKVLRDPLFHMVVIGVVLFSADSFFGGDTDQSHVIEIDEARVNWLRSVSEKQTGRAVSEAGLQHLIDSYIQDEMLYREALALGMDAEDVIVRRRLVQKMRFFIESVAHTEAPGEEELRRFYEEHQATFRRPLRFSFSHRYFSADQREDALKDAKEALAILAEAPSGTLGDPFMLPFDFAAQSRTEIARHFGEPFAAGLVDLEEGVWSEPLRSAYGWHLVRIAQRHDGAVLPYEAVADKVLSRWQEAERLKANEQAMALLREKYDVIVPAEQKP